MRDSAGSHGDDLSSPTTYFIRTFGCQMNVADSLDYARVLEDLGCVRGEDDISSDILVINTCSVRAKAEEKAISYVGAVSRERRERRQRTGERERGGIAFVGCMATVRGEEIRRRFHEVRLILPAKELRSFEDRLIEVWPELVGTRAGIEALPLLRPEERFERFVPIVRGCVCKCTYCIVPTARGDRIESRAPSEILREVERLIDAGVKSITFLGQNVCSYGTEIGAASSDVPVAWRDIPAGYGFAELLADIRNRFSSADVWFKFLTTHPRDVTDGLMEVIASDPAFSRHFHLPLQAGDDEVLRRMGRGYSSEDYLSLIDRIRAKIPDMRLTTDLIVGFPGEDERAFENTLAMVRRTGFDAAFTFLYSPRAGTPAEKWADPIPREEKRRRLQELIAVQNQITIERARRKVGDERDVFVEGPATGASVRGSGMVAGRTREEEVVALPGDEEDYGRRVRARLKEALLRSFIGDRIDARHPGASGY